MTNSLDSALRTAYDLIEANRIDDAKDMLTPLLSKYPDEPDLWWVYAHALDDPNEARVALEKVKELDPNYPEVDNLLEQVPAEAKPAGVRRLQAIPPTSLPDESQEPDVFDDEFDDTEFDNDTDEDGSSRNLLVLLAAALFGIVAIAAVLFFAFDGGEVDATPTVQIAANPTSDATDDVNLGIPENVTAEAQSSPEETMTNTSTPTQTETETALATSTEEVDITTPQVEETEVVDPTERATSNVTTQDVLTEEANTPIAEGVETEIVADPTERATPNMATEEAATSPTEEPTETATRTPMPTATPDRIARAIEAFDDFDLYEENPFRNIETDVGDALVAVVCLGEADDRSTLLSDSMQTLSDLPTGLRGNAVRLGIALFDCEREQTIRTIVVPTSTLDEFAEGTITEREFQLAWRPTG